VDDFLSKKDLQETLKSKWADLLIHGDGTILSQVVGLYKYCFGNVNGILNFLKFKMENERIGE
jgi:hypothetical protein